MTNLAMPSFGGAVAVRCPQTGRMRLTALPQQTRRARRIGDSRRTAFRRDHPARLLHPRGTGFPDTGLRDAVHLPEAEPTTTVTALTAARWSRAWWVVALRGGLGRVLLVLVAVAAVGAASALFPMRAVPQLVGSLGPAAGAVVALVSGLLLAILVPRTAVTIACGALLGATVGACASLASAVICAVITYVAGRWAGRDALSARAGSRLSRLDGWLNRRGLGAVLLVRFLPLAPFGLVGYAYGTSSVCRRRYLLGTTIAAIPSSISYAIVGAAVIAPGRMSPLSLAPAVLGFAITGVIVWRWRRTARRAGMPAALNPAT